MIIKINISLLFAYRINFYNSVIITLGWGIVSVCTIILITSKTSHVFGWTRDELYLLTGIFSITLGIFHTFFSASMERFGRIISLGQLDSYLLTPTDTQIYLSTKNFRPVSSLRIVIGLLFSLYALQQLHVPTTIISFLISTVFILSGVLLLYSLWFIVVTLMVWNPNLTNLIEFLYVFNNLGRYPPAMITYTKNIILFLFLPLTLVASVPASFLFGKANFLDSITLLICSVGLFIVSRYFWKFALRSYSSASS